MFPTIISYMYINNIDLVFPWHQFLLYPGQGGESTREEMCFSFPVYYPRADLSTCISNPVMESFVPFAQEYIPDQ